MSENRKFLLGAVLVLVVVIVAMFGIKKAITRKPLMASAEKEVALTAEGFAPARLVVKKGDTVVFVNETKREFWPASDTHPTHEIYPEFDPKQPVPAGGSWSFTFNRAGTWGYHDHLASDLVGSIVVLDDNGVAIEPSCTGAGAANAVCYQKEIVGVLEKDGLDKALDKMAELYETQPPFRDTCHGVAHSLGKAAYHIFEKGGDIHLSGKTSYCSFGFYHGFMEEMLQLSGSVDAARKFCALAQKTLEGQTTNAEGACYHGIGHGAVDGSDPRTWGDPVAMTKAGLDLCEKVDPTEPHFYRCSSGVFNSLAIMFLDPKYKLEVKGNPFSVCDLYKSGGFRVQNPCYQEMNTLVLRIAGGDFAKSIRYVEEIKEKNLAVLAMTSLAGVPPASFKAPYELDFKKTIEACQGARKDLVMPCFAGVPSGIMEFGTPGKEYQVAYDFCMSPSLSENERGTCLNTVFGGISMYYSPAKQKEICATVPEKYQSDCLKRSTPQ